MADLIPTRAFRSRRPRSRFAGLRPQVRRAAVIGAVVVVVCGIAAAAWAATRPAGASYRVATAGPASVTSSLVEVGTIEPVSQATVMFPVSGQVASVSASVGQHVSVGQQLAQLNTTSLNNAVSAEQSAVATAQARLAADQASQTSVSASSTQTTSPSSTRSSSSGSLNSAVRSLSTEQNAVRGAQQKVDTDLTLVSASVRKVAAAGAACQDLLNQLKAPPATTSASATTTPPPTTTTGATSVNDCETLINEALAAESTADRDEHALTSAVTALSSALNKVIKQVGSTSTPSTHTPSAPTNAGGGSGRNGGAGSGPASADQIAADQASVDAANAQLAAAQQNLAAATLVSPLAGTVASVTMTPGQNAAANSSAAEVLIIGQGQDQVTTAVNDSQVGQVKPGDVAAVTPDGATRAIAGTVTSVGALASTTSSGSASYPVTISLGATTEQLFAGATASVSIVLGTAKAAVTVPTSAIHRVGAFSVVEKLVGGTPTITRVTTGVVGSTLTEITSGLKPGDQVSLADITQPMPTSTNTPGAARLGGGGFGGGGGGGFGGAGRTGAGGGGGAARGGG